jgi:putative colanic acid biosynthesis glycosyltransferase WcaI
MSGSSLLMYGINYAPEPTGTALNNTGLAEALVTRGWDVTVVAGVPHYPMWRRQPASDREVRNGVSVIRRPHYVPRTQSALRRGAYELTWLASALPSTLKPRRPDVVLGIVPTLSGAAIALAAAARYGVPSALKIQDLMGRAAEQTSMAGAARVAPIVRGAEHALARRSTGVAVISESFRDYFVAGGVEPGRIWSVRDPARLGRATVAREDVRARFGWKPDEFVVLHTGSMGHKQGLETVVQAAARSAGNGGLRFVLQGDGNQRASLERLAHDLRVSNLDFLPLAPEDEFPAIVEAADALLLAQRGSVQNMARPAKLSSYLAAGRPILAAVSADDETAREVRGAEAGIVVAPEDPDALLHGVAKLRADRELLASLGENGRRYADRHLSLEGAADQMEEFLYAVAETRARPTGDTK